MPGRIINLTGEPIAVYGPNDSPSPTHDNKRYLLPSGRQTPTTAWDCDGIFVPSDREAARLIFANRTGPIAVKFIDWQRYVVIRKGEPDKYRVPFDFGTWGPAESICPTNFPKSVCWEIPNESTSDILALPLVPGHEVAQCPWVLPFPGIKRLDRLLGGDPAAVPIGVGDTDTESVEIVQELLRGHRLVTDKKRQKAFRNVPGRKSWKTAVGNETFGEFGSLTEKAVVAFKSILGAKWGLSTSNSTIDGPTLRALVLEPPSTPSPGRAYLTCILGQPYQIFQKMASLISTHEEDPKIGAFVAQTKLENQRQIHDTAGLSYGLLQWTHRSKRLATLLRRFRDQTPSAFRKTFKVTGTTLTELITHLENPATRLNADGSTKDQFKEYDLYSPRWKARFHEAGLSLALQRLQLAQAVEDIKAEVSFMKIASGTQGSGYAVQLRSEKGVGFWLDVVNQIGRGDPAETNPLNQKGGYWRYKKVLAALGIAETAPYDKSNEMKIMDRVVEQGDPLYTERRQYYRDRAPLSLDVDFPNP